MFLLTVLIKIRTFIDSTPMAHELKAYNTCPKSNPWKQWWVRPKMGSGTEKSEKAALCPSEHAGARISTWMEVGGQLAGGRKQNMYTWKMLRHFYTCCHFWKVSVKILDSASVFISLFKGPNIFLSSRLFSTISPNYPNTLTSSYLLTDISALYLGIHWFPSFLLYHGAYDLYLTNLNFTQLSHKYL